LDYFIQTSNVTDETGRILEVIYSSTAYHEETLIEYLNYDEGSTNDRSENFVFYDHTGAELGFNGFAPHYGAQEKGELHVYYDDLGHQTLFTYDYSNQQHRLASVKRSASIGVSGNYSEEFDYSYSVLSNGTYGLQSVSEKHGTQEVRNVVYSYYSSGELYGNVGDLKTSTINEGNVIVDQTYYRYYTQADIDNGQHGYLHGLKYVFGSAAYARLTDYGLTLNPIKTPSALTDAQVAPFADRYFEYDQEHRVITTNVPGGTTHLQNGSLAPANVTYDYY